MNLEQGSGQDVWVPVPDGGVDPNLVLLGLGVIALFGLVAFLAYLSHEKK